MSYKPKPWTFVEPETCKPQPKLFELEKRPFTRTRFNKSRIIRLITTEEVQYSLSLAIISGPIPAKFSWR